MNPFIFREYDVRGIAERDLTDEVAVSLGRAFAARLRESGGRSVALGRDVRHSSPRLAAALSRGLVDSGCEVVDIGVIPTPGLYYGVIELGTDGGVMITGSHNPIEYNGFKMQVGTESLHGEEIRALARRIEADDYLEAAPGRRREESIQDRYQQMIVDRCRPARPLKVVVDAGNGTAGPTARAVFRALGHQVVPLYCEPDGSFPNHPPDPTVEAYTADLKAAVLREGADLGCGYDGDADRIGLVDEKARFVPGDQIVALFAREALERYPGAPIVFDVKCSQALEDVVTAAGGRPVMWRTGHSLTKAKMRQERAPVAGEVSGHIFFLDGFFGHDDAIYASARLTAQLSRAERPLSALVDSLPRYCTSPEIRIGCPDQAKFRVVEEVTAEFSREYETLTLDGVRARILDGWGLLRASNTQPALTLRFESRSPEGLRAIEERFRCALDRFPEVDWPADRGESG